MTASTEVMWYKTLKKKDLAELATVLAKHSLEVWNNFHLDSSLQSELKTLPEKAMTEIEAALKDNSHHRLKEHFNSFITPVLHIRDGYLKFPYEVRLAFLSVFHILHGLISTNNLGAAKDALASSITKSIDAIKIGGILPAEEIASITNKYYLLSKKI